MNKLDKQLIEMVLKNHTYFQYGALMHAKDMDFAKEFVSQIKQSILKAIMEKKPEIYHNDRKHDCDGCGTLGRKEGVEEFESVIKELLSK